MKYYCKSCETVFLLDEENEPDFFKLFDNCPVCENYAEDYVSKIPDYETPQQYEKRTGKPVRNDMAVWALFLYENTGFDEWKPLKLIEANKRFWGRAINAVVIADPPVPPPDNWKPEDNE